MLEDVYDFLARFLIFPVDHFRPVVTRNLINNSRNQALRGKFHLEIAHGKIQCIKISDPKNTKCDLQFAFLFRNDSILRIRVYSPDVISLIYEFTNNIFPKNIYTLLHNLFEKKVVLRNFKQ